MVIPKQATGISRTACVTYMSEMVVGAQFSGRRIRIERSKKLTPEPQGLGLDTFLTRLHRIGADPQRPLSIYDYDQCGQTPNGIPNPFPFNDLRQNTDVVGLGLPGTCPPISNLPVPNVTTTASQGTFFLSEIAAGLPGVILTDPSTQGPLHDFLAQNLCFGPHAYGTLVVDEEWVINRPILLQPRTTLAGVGRAGRGRIFVADLPPGSGAIELYQGPESNNHIVIRDLYIIKGGPKKAQCGIRISNGFELRIENCLIQNFRVGIFAEKTIAVWLEKVVVSANRNGIVLNGGNFFWRIRDCTLNTNNCWGVIVFGYADGPDPYPGQGWGWGNDFLFSGCRIEGNGSGGVYFGGIYGVFDGIHFEGNGLNNAGQDLMIRVAESEANTGFCGCKNTGQVKVLSSFLGQGRVKMLFAPSNTPLTPSTPGVIGQQANYHIEAEYNMYYWGPGGEPFRAPVPW